MLALSLVGATALAVPAPIIRAQTFTNVPTVIQAGQFVPDAVATGLMPVPIYNFAIHNVSFSPDGQKLAAGDGHGTVRLWEVATGKLLNTITAHTNWAFAVAWSRDGSRFATGGSDRLVKLFAAADPAQPLKTFRGHQGDAHSVVMTPDGRHIVSAGDDREIIVWNIQDEKPERQWTAHERQIPTLALSPDGAILASGSRDHSIRLWDPATGKRLSTLTGHTGDVMSVTFSPDGKLLASASYDHTVRLWDVATGKCLRIFQGHTDRVFSVAFSPDGRRLVSAGDSTARIWDVQNGASLMVISPGGTIVTGNGVVKGNLSAIAFSPDGKTLAVASTTGMVLLLSAETGAVIRQLKPVAE